MRLLIIAILLSHYWKSSRACKCRFYSLPSEGRCDSRSSDLELATCRDRLTTSASRPRNPEPKPTRRNARQPCTEVGTQSTLHRDVDYSPEISPEGPGDRPRWCSLRLHRGWRRGSDCCRCAELSAPGSPNSSSRSRAHGRGRMTDSVSKPSRKKLRQQRPISNVAPHSGHRDSPLFVSLSPRVGPSL
jgi:hypothetical protein